jgi:hypothetical protein
MTGESKYPFAFKLPPWIAVIFILIVCIIVLWVKNREIAKDFKMHRQFNITVSLFFLFFGIGRVFFLLSDFERTIHGQTALHYQFVTYSYMCGVSAMASAIYYMDKYVLKPDKLIISKLLLGGAFVFLPILVLISIFYYELVLSIRMVMYISLILSAIFLIVAAIRIARAIDISDFHDYLNNIIGFILMTFGVLFDIEIMYQLIFFDFPILIFIPPLLFIFGAILFTSNIDIVFKLMLEFYISQQICLVHRGEIEGKKHICPNCFVKYCDQCFNSVILIEKKCWACNFDYSTGKKPSQFTAEPTEVPEQRTRTDIEDDHKPVKMAEEVGFSVKQGLTEKDEHKKNKKKK